MTRRRELPHWAKFALELAAELLAVAVMGAGIAFVFITMART